MIKRIPYQYFIILLSILGCITVIFAFTGKWPWNENPYNTYAIQANAWLNGHLDVGENREWLELAIYEGKYYSSFPLFPSYLLLPFAVIFGESTPDHWIVLLITCIGAVYAAKLYRKTVSDTGSMIFYVLFLFLSSGYLFIGGWGPVWFFAQSICFTLCLMSLYYAVLGKGGWSLAFWACAVGCRPFAVLYLPVLIMLIWKAWDGEHFVRLTGQQSAGVFFRKMGWLIKKRWYWAVAPTLIAASYMILNYARFGNPFEFGHNYLPEFMREANGQFSFDYLPNNLDILFRIPTLREDSGIAEFPLYDGFAFYISMPIFLVILGVWIYAWIKKRKTEWPYLILFPILFVYHVIALCMHRTLGGWSFGCRYLLDTLPWMFFALIRWKPNSKKLDRWLLPLMIFGAALNLVGTVATYNFWI